MLKKLRISVVFIFLFPLIHGQVEESISKIGESSTVSYVMYTDNDGNLYYVNTKDHYLNLMKYELESGTTSNIAQNFAYDGWNGSSAKNEGFGAVAPTVSGDTVYCMTAQSSGEIYRLICSEDKFEYITSICGSNFWKIFNLTLSKDGKTLYYVSNNNLPSDKGIRKIDLETLECSEVLELDALIPHRDLCFGGVNVWDEYGNFYVPVWSYDYDDSDLVLMKVHAEEGNYSAQLIHFTDNGLESGNVLLPGFRHNSCWSGIGASLNGNIYIAASNHYQSKTGAGEHGNVAIYKYNPALDEISLLGDLKSVSSSVNNWMEGESQHKIHTFLMENADGKMYCASDDYYPSHFIRGAHVYTIDLETDEISDYSKTQSYVMKRDFSLVENQDFSSETSGVFCEYYGIKGISLNQKTPEIMYAMTFSNPNGIVDPGYIIKHEIESDFTIPSGISPEIISGIDEIGVYPNPFKDQVYFQFGEQQTGDDYSLRIFDINGRLIFIGRQGNLSTYTWDGLSSDGESISDGLYFYSIQAGDKTFRGKILKSGL